MTNKLKLISIGAIILAIIYSLLGYIVRINMFYYPIYEKIDLMPILTKVAYTDSDYLTILQQTGINIPLVNELKKTDTFIEDMLRFQQNYYKPLNVQTLAMNAITSWEKALDEDGKVIPAFEIAPYKNGYIFLTKSTFTVNYRHGHAGLIVDDVHGKILESSEPFTDSSLFDAKYWEYFPTFKMMRPIGVSQEVLDEIAKYAITELTGKPYNLLNLKFTTASTQCALLPWQAFKAFDIDIDGDNGMIITPADIAKSNSLEVMQIFGFDYKRVW
ncbi:MAG: hypothetical protein ATN33_02985 [Epulopiscium sp. Nele67-Bin001]|nr:MAG: hypothetical protein ATN33_02985 [Epulopiscium sp. Nele67-Bin001]